jgi:hypothetical protein
VRFESSIVIDPYVDELEINGLLDRVSLSNEQFEKVMTPVGERVYKEFDEENVVTDVGLTTTDVALNNPAETETRANVGVPVNVKEQEEREREDPEEEKTKSSVLNSEGISIFTVSREREDEGVIVIPLDKEREHTSSSSSSYDTILKRWDIVKAEERERLESKRKDFSLSELK